MSDDESVGTNILDLYGAYCVVVGAGGRRVRVGMPVGDGVRRQVMSRCQGHVGVTIEYDVLKDREFSVEHGRLYPSMSAIIEVQPAQFAIGIGWEDAKRLGRRFGGSVDRHIGEDLQKRIHAAIEAAAKEHVIWLTVELDAQRSIDRYGHIEKGQIGEDPPCSWAQMYGRCEAHPNGIAIHDDNPAERIEKTPIGEDPISRAERITVRPWNDKDDFPEARSCSADDTPVTEPEQDIDDAGICSRCGMLYHDCARLGCR